MLQRVNWRRLLASFSFSFIVIAFVLIWMAREHTGFDRDWRAALAVLCVGLGVWGIRERHRRMRG